jgi:hypothetical protein
MVRMFRDDPTLGFKGRALTIAWAEATGVALRNAAPETAMESWCCQQLVRGAGFDELNRTACLYGFAMTLRRPDLLNLALELLELGLWR